MEEVFLLGVKGQILNIFYLDLFFFFFFFLGAQWLSGRVLDSRPKGRGFEPHRRHCVVSLSKNINPSLVLVQPRKTRPFITKRLLMGRKESNQTNKTLTFYSRVILAIINLHCNLHIIGNHCATSPSIKK